MTRLLACSPQLVVDAVWAKTGFAQTVRAHGPGRLYSGFAAYYMRLAPQSMVTLCTLEWLKVSAHSRACAPRSTVTD